MGQLCCNGRSPPKSFDEWKETHETNEFRNQIALAMQLYDETYVDEEGFGTDPRSPRRIVREIKRQRYDSESIVQWKGIKADWILDVFCQTKFVRKLIEFDCDCWFVRDVCFIVYLLRKGITNEALIERVDVVEGTDSYGGQVVVETANTFVSYTGRYKFKCFVEMLEKLRGKYIWMDLFCVNQFAWNGGKGSEELERSRDALVNGLRDSIEQIGSVVLLWEKWDGIVDTVRQIWVMWEVYNALTTDADFSLLLTSGEWRRFLVSFKRGRTSDDVMTQLREMDVNRLKAESSSDKKAILEKVADTQITLGQISGKVCDRIRALFCEWVQRQGMDLLRHDDMGDKKLTTIHNMAYLLYSQGKYDEAEPLYRDALEKRRRILGDDHPYTLSSINNLASLLESQGKYEEAEPLYREVLETYRLILGDDHPVTLSSINNFAALLKSQGKYDAAEPLYRDALEKRRRILGDDHPDTLISMDNLAGLLNSQGKYDKAETLCSDALEKSRRILGDDHPNTLTSMNNLASLLQSRGKYDEAETLYTDALEKRRRILGDDHPDTFISMNNLASLLQSRGKYDEAETLYTDALEKRLRILGDDHPYTFTSTNNLAGLLESQGKYDKAEPLYRDALEKSRRILGVNHPDTLAYHKNLVEITSRLERSRASTS